MSDSLTKVMTMPKHHVKKCGLNDVRGLVAACVFASVSLAEGKRQIEEQIDYSTWFVLLVVLVLGLFMGCCCGWKLKGMTMKLKKGDSDGGRDRPDD